MDTSYVLCGFQPCSLDLRNISVPSPINRNTDYSVWTEADPDTNGSSTNSGGKFITNSQSKIFQNS